MIPTPRAGILTLWLGAPLAGFAQEIPPPTSVPLDETVASIFDGVSGAGSYRAPDAYTNFRLFLEYDADADSRLLLGDDEVLELPPGNRRVVEIACEQPDSGPGLLRIWHEGKAVGQRKFPGRKSGATTGVVAPDGAEGLRFDRDFTAMVRFSGAEKGGTLMAMAMPEGNWVRGAKAIFIHNGRITYDIGWKGAITGSKPVGRDGSHVAVLAVRDGEAVLYLDGEASARRGDFSAPDPKGAILRIGSAADDFGGRFDGRFEEVRIWKRALSPQEIGLLSSGKASSVNTADFDWMPEGSGADEAGVRPLLEAGKGFMVRRAFVQPLAVADHAEIVAGWNAESVRRGAEIYQQLCVTCHGTLEAPGSLPTAPRFHESDLHNGSDPYRMLQTLDKGYGQMVPQPQYSTAQKYDVIHYIREHFFKGRNDDQLAVLDEDYLRMLPRGMALKKEKSTGRKVPQYLLQDFGNVMFWTLQVAPGNIAQKGIAIRLDEGPGGVSKGRAWMLYDHDTMRLAACWTGDRFVDWRNIAFDGSHATHTSIVGEIRFSFPNEPMWANPATGDFKDQRILGRDGKPYGPLPREWVHFKGVELHGDRPVLRYTVGDRELIETPGLGRDGGFERVIDVGPGSDALKLRRDGNRLHEIPAADAPSRLVVRYTAEGIETTEAAPDPPGPAKSERFGGRLTTMIEPAAEVDGPWAVDTLTIPEPNHNPWQSWMRTTGFDFFEGGDRAAVCTWDGDVWIVDGIAKSEGELTWQRICSGLFQPLGLKIVDGEVYVGCRDMIAHLRDLDGDREIDVIENFNNDHQVTENFHEFAMGLQTDDEGNFYYAKSARHGRTALVPHHGTLLKVGADGSKTEILATGFRAANGVCLNPDGSFMVTDQEGNWNPKNRINWVEGKGRNEFYGNMWGYHDVTDESDSAMRQPVCWITNAFDRSPGELLWVPEDSAWKPLRGSLLNLSYGAGRIYTVPFERKPDGVQGGMCAFPIEPFPTGVMRGRFSPADGQLYACGMFAWAGNRHEPGGFFRVRYTGEPACQPVGLATSPGTLKITFSDPLDPDSINEPDAWAILAWDLKRTQQYGSRHHNERTWKVANARLSADGKTVTLDIPELAPTWGMSVKMKLRGADGRAVEREMHQSIFSLN